MGWKRRFGNRVEESSSDPVPVQDDLCALPKGVSDSAYVLSSREESQGKPYIHNNKIYPGNLSNEQAEDEAKRQVTLQKRICLALAGWSVLQQ